MAKFDVYRMVHRDGYLLDCQADLLSEFATRFVAPLLPIAEAPSPVR
jgi:toxin CcdB